MDERGLPVSGAVVRVQATKPSVGTDSRGRFVLAVDRREDVVLTAWKEGYLNGASTPSNARDDQETVIVLKPVPAGDDPDYRWISPNMPTFLERADILWRRAIVALSGREELASRFGRNCSNCHAESAVAEWQADVHSRTARNPIVLSMYNGTDAHGRGGVFPGYRLDFPNSEGNCANCHVPVHALTSEGGADLNRVSGMAREGIFCDFCHKVSDVTLHPDGGFPGVSSMELARPPEGEQIFYGPLDDVIAGPDTFAPVYTESRFCSACHNVRFWGVPIYSEFEEWSQSPYAREGIHCQDCHMASHGTATHVVPPDKGGVERDPQSISTHTFRGVGDVRFMSEAIALDVSASRKAASVDVTVSVSNVAAGHHFPTGVPMRNVILLLEAVDASGKRLEQVEGPVVPDWGGRGRPDQGNYAGLPGKGFAKVLGDAAKSFPRPTPGYRSPTPHWRQAVIVSDNRIPARATDVSRYAFRRERDGDEPITVTTRVLYRRSFKRWIDAKGWPLEDLEIARKETVVAR